LNKIRKLKNLNELKKGVGSTDNHRDLLFNLYSDRDNYKVYINLKITIETFIKTNL